MVFTDIEGSTRLLQELGPARYVRALEDHRRLLRDALARNGGVEVEMQGDSFHFGFADAGAAVRAAAEAQCGLAEHDWETEPIRVRIGIHAGKPLISEGLYAGLDVHRAARVMSAGHGGQVLLTESVRELTEDALHDELSLRDLGEHRLKDLLAPQRLYQLGQGEFPPLKSLYQTNLPVPPTPFLGRGRELREVTGLLREANVRLLTMTGVGGTGKTRLAAQAAAEVSELYPDGIFWVGLAAIRDPAVVTATIARALGSDDGLAKHIGSRRLLVLLDNFEHLLGAADELAELLRACPELNLLVTSREPLHLLAEREYAVRPLDESDAVTLFNERVRATGTEPDAPAHVPEICRRLDGLPLAIELAAARVKVLSTRGLLERLERRLPLLTTGPRDLPDRQRTLRATIDWSYELLAEDERTLFARLAVFAGGCTLETAEQICAADLDTLQSLVDKSLLRRTGERFSMLETIREYALEQLEGSGERATTERRHSDHYAAFATGLEEAFFGAAGMDAHQRLDPEHDNLRAVLRRALDHGEGDVALRLATALAPFWRSSHNREGLAWLEQGLAAAGPETQPLRARAHLRASVLAGRCGDNSRALWHCERTLEVAREVGDDTAAASASVNLGVQAVKAQDYESAATRFADAADFFAQVGDPYRRSMALNNLAGVMLIQGKPENAAELVATALSLLPEGEEEETASILHTDGEVRLALGDARAARSAFAQLLDAAVRLHDTTLVAAGVEGLAAVAAAEGDSERAASLFGFVNAYCIANEVSDPTARELAEPYARDLHEHLSADELERARRRGEAMSTEDAVADALS
jgi:predicted ATPase